VALPSGAADRPAGAGRAAMFGCRSILPLISVPIAKLPSLIPLRVPNATSTVAGGLGSAFSAARRNGSAKHGERLIVKSYLHRVKLTM